MPVFDASDFVLLDLFLSAAGPGIKNQNRLGKSAGTPAVFAYSSNIVFPFVPCGQQLQNITELQADAYEIEPYG
jgi:hypothetical protein